VTLGAAGFLGIALAGYVWFWRNPPRPLSPGAVLSEEQKAYFSRILVDGPRMSAAQNFVGDTVNYLDARVSNRGEKLVRQLDIQLEFHDTLNQVVLRQNARPISPRTAPLKPGEARQFQVTFEHMPADWNRAPPSMRAMYIGF
jgi:hypothetical protein